MSLTLGETSLVCSSTSWTEFHELDWTSKRRRICSNSSLHFLCRVKDHGRFPEASSPERALRKPGAFMKALRHPNDMTSFCPTVYLHAGTEPKCSHNAPIQTCKAHQLREYFLLPCGKMPNGHHICLTDGGSDRLHRFNGASLSVYSISPESLRVGNSCSGPDRCICALQMIRSVFVTATFTETQRTTLSHADATQTGWPRKIAPFPPRPILIPPSWLRRTFSGARLL